VGPWSRGDTQVITHALVHGADRVVIDDLEVRRCAKAMGLRIIGTLCVVGRAKAMDKIAQAAPVIAHRRRTRLYVSDDLVQHLPRQVGGWAKLLLTEKIRDDPAPRAVCRQHCHLNIQWPPRRQALRNPPAPFRKPGPTRCRISRPRRSRPVLARRSTRRSNGSPTVCPVSATSRPTREIRTKRRLTRHSTE
jgi:hypothetical protein